MATELLFCSAALGANIGGTDTDFANYGVLNPQDDGVHVTVTWVNKGGGVLSVQQDGSFQTRPAGTNGPFELATFDGTGLTFVPVYPRGYRIACSVVKK